MKKILHAILLLLFALPLPAIGQDVPVPSSKIDSLKAYKQELEEKRAGMDTSGIEKEIENLGKNLNETRSRLVGLASSIQDNENELATLENDINQLQVEREALDKKLAEDRSAIAKLLLALERIRRVPPQALITRPEAPLKTAQSAMLLGNIIPTLNARAEELKVNIQRQTLITSKMEEKRNQVQSRSDTLKKEEIVLSRLATEREKIFKATQSDFRQKQEDAEKISRQSKSVSELVSKLEDNIKREAARALTSKAVREAALTRPPSQPMTALPKIGGGGNRLPISGVIKVRYNDRDKFGAKSEGIRIEGRTGALVVAPMPGTVRFAGSFKNYGQMVIIEHDGGYHSLVAGLEKVDTLVGQNISAGEPVGKLKSSIKDEKPTLYYELRYKGNAIDPAKKFSDLG